MITLLDSKSTENHRDHYRWYDKISGRSAASLGLEPQGWQDVNIGPGGWKWRTKRNSRGVYTTYDYTESITGNMTQASVSKVPGQRWRRD